MFAYIQKFNNLPAEVKEKISNPKMTALIEELEKQYGIELVKVIMQVMTKDLSLDYLGLYFMEEFGLSGEAADNLVHDLYKYVFSAVADWLGLEPLAQTSPPPADRVSAEKKAESLAADKVPVGDRPMVDVSRVRPDKEKLQSAPMDAPSAAPATAGKSSFSPTLKPTNQSADKQNQPAGKQRISQTQLSAAQAQPSGPLPAARAAVSPAGKAEPAAAARPMKSSAVSRKAAPPKTNQLGTEEILDEILGQIEIIFSSQQANQRLHQLIRTYLRGLRKRTEAKMILTSPYQKGGLGLAEPEAEEILAAADKKRDDFTAALSRETAAGQAESHILPRKTKPESHLPAGKKQAPVPSQGLQAERDVPYDFARLTAAQTSQPAKAQAAGSLQAKPADGPKAASGAAAPARATPAKTPGLKLHGADSLADQVLSVKEKKPARPAQPSQKTGRQKPTVAPAAKRPPMASGKPRLDDVTYAPRVMGPIDELRQMSLLDFRRLNPDPVKACQKIKEKIELLGEEQYAKRIEAIKAWRQSPVNKLYAKIGQQSIAQKQPVDKIIASQKQAGHECLTIAEFEAIMDLNKELRF